MEPLKLTLQVSAGVIPGEPMPEYNRYFHMTSPDYESANGPRIFAELQEKAIEYFKSLNDPNVLNWSRLDWVYY